MYLIDCSHGYDRHSIHLATRFPKRIPFNNILATFPLNIWMANLASLLLLVVFLLISVSLYMSINPDLVRMNLDGFQILLRLVFGITQRDDHAYFETFSTGISLITFHCFESL